MTERIWDKFLTEGDKAVFAAGGFGERQGFGQRRLGQCLYFQSMPSPRTDPGSVV